MDHSDDSNGSQRNSVDGGKPPITMKLKKPKVVQKNSPQTHMMVSGGSVIGGEVNKGQTNDSISEIDLSADNEVDSLVSNGSLAVTDDSTTPTPPGAPSPRLYPPGPRSDGPKAEKRPRVPKGDGSGGGPVEKKAKHGDAPRKASKKQRVYEFDEDNDGHSPAGGGNMEKIGTIKITSSNGRLQIQNSGVIGKSSQKAAAARIRQSIVSVAAGMGGGVAVGGGSVGSTPVLNVPTDPAAAQAADEGHVEGHRHGNASRPYGVTSLLAQRQKSAGDGLSAVGSAGRSDVKLHKNPTVKLKQVSLPTPSGGSPGSASTPARQSQHAQRRPRPIQKSGAARLRSSRQPGRMRASGIGLLQCPRQAAWAWPPVPGGASSSLAAAAAVDAKGRKGSLLDVIDKLKKQQGSSSAGASPSTSIPEASGPISQKEKYDAIRPARRCAMGTNRAPPAGRPLSPNLPPLPCPPSLPTLLPRHSDAELCPRRDSSDAAIR